MDSIYSTSVYPRGNLPVFSCHTNVSPIYTAEAAVDPNIIADAAANSVPVMHVGGDAVYLLAVSLCCPADDMEDPD